MLSYHYSVFEMTSKVKYSWEIWNPSPTINEVWLEIDWIVLQGNLKCQWNFLRLDITLLYGTLL